MAKEKSKSKHWEREAKVGAEKVKRAEKERDEAKQEAKVAHLTAIPVGYAKAKVEDDLNRVQHALAVAEEDGRKLEAEVSSLAVERTSLLLERGASKDEVSSFHSQAGKDKEAMEEDYQKALGLMFSYGYGCCAFKHSIYSDQPGIPDDMPDSADPLPLEFFMNPRCPPALTVVKVKAVEVDLGEVAKDSGEDVVEEEHS